ELLAGGDQAGKEAVDAKCVLEVVGAVKGAARPPDQRLGVDAPVACQGVCAARGKQEDVRVTAPAADLARLHLVPAGQQLPLLELSGQSLGGLQRVLEAASQEGSQ